MMPWLYIFFAMSAFLFFALLTFPMALAAIGTCSPKRNVRDMDSRRWPGVSLIVAAFNESAVIKQKTLNAVDLTYSGEFEIIVANDGSTDDTVAISRSIQNDKLRVLDFKENRGKASVVNDAVAEARYDVICLSDANVMFRPDALRKMVSRLQGERIGAVSGDVRLASHESSFGEGESLYYKLERAVHRGESRIGSMMGVDGGMYVIRKELFRNLPPDTILDDFVITMNVIKQGFRVVYEPDAVATENGTPRARDEFRRRIRVAAGAMQSLKRGQFPPIWRPIEFLQYISHKLLRWLGPVWLLALFVSNCFLWNEGALYQAALIGQTAVYLAAGLATVCVPFRRTPGGRHSVLLRHEPHRDGHRPCQRAVLETTGNLEADGAHGSRGGDCGPQIAGACLVMRSSVIESPPGSSLEGLAVDGHTGAALSPSLFHRPEWEQVFAVYGLRWRRLTVQRDGQLVGVLPLVWQKSWLFGQPARVVAVV